MKYLLILIIFIPFLSACENANNQTTELEGLWESECIGSFSTFITTAEQKSNTITMDFKGYNIETNVKTYTDNQCETLESTVPVNEANNIFSENKAISFFSIGEPLIASNGLPAREIDMTLEDGEIYLSIYQLQENSNSLYFGGPCLKQEQEIPILGNITPCVNERSIDISFSLKYIKQ